MARLSPIDEARFAHSIHCYSTIGFLVFLLSTVSLLVVAYDHREHSVRMESFNFGWIFEIAFAAGREREVAMDEVGFRSWDFEAEFRHIANGKYTHEEEQKVFRDIYVKPKYEEITNDSEKWWNNDANHRKSLYADVNRPFLHDTYYVIFCTTAGNACTYPPGGRPDGLPSILRTMELSCTAQVSVRILVLITFFMRWYFTFIRCIRAQNTNQDCCHRILACITPKLQLLEMAFAFLLACLQQSNDYELKWLFPIVTIGWASSMCLFMLSYTLVTLIDRTALDSSRLALMRIACLTMCIFCSPIWVANHLHFLKNKSCFAEVPVREALSEYATLVAVMVFAVTQLYEMRNYFGLLSCSEGDAYIEVSTEFEFKYRPAEVHSRQTSFRKTSISSKTAWDF